MNAYIDFYAYLEHTSLNIHWSEKGLEQKVQQMWNTNFMINTLFSSWDN
jgi:hypothetical protein